MTHSQRHCLLVNMPFTKEAGPDLRGAGGIKLRHF